VVVWDAFVLWLKIRHTDSLGWGGVFVAFGIETRAHRHFTGSDVFVVLAYKQGHIETLQGQILLWFLA
jgi:hypothetical protein